MTSKLKKNQQAHPVDAPLYHSDHAKPFTRRDFIRQGFMGGSASLISGGVFSLFAAPNTAMAALSADVDSLAADINCSLGGLTGDAKVPFICFDLAGGANLAGSNVLIGGAGGQNDGTISTAGYSKMGIPGDMVPGLDSSAFTPTLLNLSANNDFVNDELGLEFHADSAMLMGILERAGASVGNVDGCVIPARSGNDTSNNPHNPLYGIALAGGKGSVVDLVGSRSTDSGGNSMAPADMINAEVRPTKVDRPSDVTGMVDVGELTAILSNPADVTAVMESMARITHKKLKLDTVTTGLVTRDEVVKDLVRCGYLKAAELADRFAGREVDPTKDTNILDIFTADELENDGEFRKTASVMKMVLNGYSAGGCITMGGYDYHTGDRRTGENRDLRAGRCIGACLNYAQKQGKPLMIYVYSDGSVASNGMRDDTADMGTILGGRGKGVWTGDNSSTACSYMLVYNPTAKPTTLVTPSVIGRQLGRFSADASVVTSSSPAANNVNLLVNTVLLNYMSLNGDIGQFASTFPNHGLGSAFDQYAAFGPLT
ncbi:MAG: general secretion pathway protein GspF [Gammaproteobacteria bacterium]|nr:general secretion pathway protein GspF [Gammaproteobacteria bacterium]MBT4193665.1 general secretion pathway protein GspF [Gammaproteobacteria bacterium]MBT4862557.1 general secretion pathway protein GspF [Gammaproteobacteria bacterium]MBT6552815.1 general secretion pathway protein GspF [Gammaproteobacteria bacterium]MBT6702365.1 general secretion pathway protein GspF [Gammaproteobacteria bacterium]